MSDVKMYTPTHPLSPEERNGLSGPEAAKPITIGKDCWLGGGSIILPGITVGDGSTIGAGAVVRRMWRGGAWWWEIRRGL